MMTATLEIPSPVVAAAAKLKVWLVDDNDRLRRLIGEMLGLETDIECARQFSSPNQVLSTLASRPGPDVILLDVQMGGCSGLDAVRAIKSLTPTTRILMFTTCLNPEWRSRALSEGASDYLLKTDGLNKIVNQIRSPNTDANQLTQLRRRSKRLVNSAVTHISKSEKPNSILSRPLSRLRAWWG